MDSAELAGWIEARGLPPGVRGGTATRQFAGVSLGAYRQANFGERCGDDPTAVASNRALLRQALGLSVEPRWLRQVHGVEVVVVEADSAASPALHEAPEEAPLADACIVRGGARAAVVQTADCLPILLASSLSSEVAAVHAGWRGLAAGVIEATLARMAGPAGAVHAWIGPAIAQHAFEVGPEVRAALVAADSLADACFRAGRGDRWHANLVELARLRLRALGVSQISGGAWCSLSSADQFHSFRRDGAASGRMASLIWRP